MKVFVRQLTALVGFAVLVGACTAADPATSTSAPGPGIPPVPVLDSSLLVAGEEVYQQSCASCHGADLEGQEDWKIPDAEGFRPAPPQDASGHTWHHSDELILKIVRDGLNLGPTRMPTFADQLSDEEMTAVLEYLKSTWGPEERAFQWQITWQESQIAN